MLLSMRSGSLGLGLGAIDGSGGDDWVGAINDSDFPYGDEWREQHHTTSVCVGSLSKDDLYLSAQ